MEAHDTLGAVPGGLANLKCGAFDGPTAAVDVTNKLFTDQTAVSLPFKYITT
jgi:hypothetical protein